MCINIERGSKKTLWNYNWHLSARNWRSPHRNCFMNEVTDVRKDLLVISIPMMSWSILEHWPQSWLEEAHIYKLFSISIVSIGLFLSRFSFSAQLAEIQKFHNSFWMEITIFTHFIFHVTKVITFFSFLQTFVGYLKHSIFWW